MVTYTESTKAGDWHKTWVGQRAEKASGVPLSMNAANLQCTLPLLWHMEDTATWLGEQVWRKASRAFGADWSPGGRRGAIWTSTDPKPQGELPWKWSHSWAQCQVHHAGLGQMKDREPASWNLRLPLPPKWDGRNCYSFMQEYPNIAL